MPPKKKARGRHAAADDDSPPVPEPVIFDGWTDEQETTLFKAISVYRLKPAGEPLALAIELTSANLEFRDAQALPYNRHC